MSQAQAEECVDVVICGSGSAGLACALWLAVYNDRYCKGSAVPPITYRVLEARDGPLQLGQADGVQCRTVEIYESFGMDHLLKDEAYWVNEVSFWALDDTALEQNGTQSNGSQPKKRLVRTGRTADVQPGLSHQPHVILNQARINMFMLNKIEALKGRDVEYNWKVTGLDVSEDENTVYPVKVLAEQKGQKKTFRAKYVLGADGAHSQIRHSLKIAMEGDTTNAVWGVMDVFPRTNFPDYRKKATIRSDTGTLMIIPREGDSMIRTYFELPHGTNPKSVTLEELHKTAREKFQPYDFDVLKTYWWSAYSIGQRVAKSMVDDSGRIFLAGDACHTHSPKAGQGMNASLQDGYNIGWKLGSVLTGQADESILQTYVQERHEYAKQLIDFDRYFAKLFSVEARADGTKPKPEEFNQAFIKSGVFTAGMAANYSDSTLVDAQSSNQELAKDVVIGQRLPSAQVVRMSDSKPLPLLKLLQSDGRWRLVIFAGDVEDEQTIPRLNQIGAQLQSVGGAIARFTPEDSVSDLVIDTVVIVHGDRTKVEFDQIDAAFKPKQDSTPESMINLHKIFFDDESWNWGHGHAYQKLGIAPKQGCIVVARPDQYVAAVLGLDQAPQLSDLFVKFGAKPVKG